MSISDYGCKMKKNQLRDHLGRASPIFFGTLVEFCRHSKISDFKDNQIFKRWHRTCLGYSCIVGDTAHDKLFRDHILNSARAVRQ